MKLSPRRQQEIRTFVWTLLVVACVGSVLGLIFSIAMGGGYIRGIGQGTFTATFISVFIGSLTIFYRNTPRGHWLRRLSFKQALLLNSLTYLLIITIGIRVSVFVFDGIGFLDFSWLATETLIALMLSLTIAVLINLGQQMDRMLGQGVIKKYLSGAYHKPQQEERVFLFVDIIGSTGVAEEVGPVNFHALLDQFFYDLTDPILANKGEIHKYVGDEVIISWPVDAGEVKGNAIQCFFDIKQKIQSHETLYQEKFGFVPRFRGAVNMGSVVTGEIGDIKQEIVFLGDTVNTTARILSKTSELNREFLIAKSVLDTLPLPDALTSEDLGAQSLRGRQKTAELISLSEAPSASALVG